MRESRETDEVLVCMAQRLQSQLERQLTLVERLQTTGRDETLADLAELRTSMQRALRGSENLLVLGGAQQGPRARGPRSVADVLTDARAGVEDVSGIGLGPAPDASIAPRAVAGLVALFTELLTHCTSVAAPLTRVDVGSARSEDGGVTVEVVVDGPAPTGAELDELNRRLGDRPIIDDIVSNRVGLFVAARLARRCGAALRVQHRRDSLAAGGIVVVVHCPPDLLDAVAFVAPSAPAAGRPWNRDPAGRNGNGHPGNGRSGNGHPPNGSGGSVGTDQRGSDPRGSDQRGSDRPGSDHGPGHNGLGGGGLGGDRAGVNGVGNNRLGDNRPGDNRLGGPQAPAAPERSRRPDPLSDPIPGFARRDPEPPRRPEPSGAEPSPAREPGVPRDARAPERARRPERPAWSEPVPQAEPAAWSEPTDRSGSAPRSERGPRSEAVPPSDPAPRQESAPRSELARTADPARSEPARSEPTRSEPAVWSEPRRAEPPRRSELPRRSESDRQSAPLRSGPIRSELLRSEPLRSEPLWRDEPRRPEDPFRPGGPIRPAQPAARPVEPPRRPTSEALWGDDDPPLQRGRGDAELFGPLTTSLRDRMRESGPTPIYEAVASAWFVEGDGTPAAAGAPGAPPTDWNTPSDAEWRAASERAARPVGPPAQSTAAGLPRRRPGTQMVAPPRHGTPAPPNGSREREPERVRERLAVYQQGLERGRHRAADDR